MRTTQWREGQAIRSRTRRAEGEARKRGGERRDGRGETGEACLIPWIRCTWGLGQGRGEGERVTTSSLDRWGERGEAREGAVSGSKPMFHMNSSVPSPCPRPMPHLPFSGAMDSYILIPWNEEKVAVIAMDDHSRDIWIPGLPKFISIVRFRITSLEPPFSPTSAS